MLHAIRPLARPTSRSAEYLCSTPVNLKLGKAILNSNLQGWLYLIFSLCMEFVGVQWVSLKVNSKVFSDTWAPKTRHRESEIRIVTSPLTTLLHSLISQRGESWPQCLEAAPGEKWITESSGHQPVKGKVSCCNQLCLPRAPGKVDGEVGVDQPLPTVWASPCLPGPARAQSNTYPVPSPVCVIS